MTARRRVSIAKPNGGSVSNKDVATMLYEMDRANAARYASLQDGINGLHDRMNAHDDRHNESKRQAIKEEIQLDAKKAGIIATLSAVISALVIAVRAKLSF